MTRQQKFTQQIISGVLFIVVLGMLGWLSDRYKTELDWTAGHRNTLTEASRKQLDSMKGPIKFIAFMYPDAETRRDVDMWTERYKRVKPDINVEYINPAAHPEKVKEYNIDSAGEVVIDYQGRRETVRALNERAVTGALQRLAYSGDRFIVFLEGHGERSINGHGDNDFDQLAQALRDKGLKVQSVNLVATPSIPDNTSLLVLARPTSKLLEGEVKLIENYLQAGGNLLWLTDPETPTIEGLEKALGIAWQQGYAIFPNYQILGTGNPAIYLATSYPAQNPVTHDLDEVTAFPLAQSLKADPNSGWHAEPMLQTDANAWLETGKIGGEISFDPKSGDIPGPLTIGMTLTRDVKAPAATADKKDENKPADAKAAANGSDKDNAAKKDAAKAEQPIHQRVVLVGDSDFLSDANLGAFGNRQLGLNIMQWLASRDAQLNIDIPTAPDTSLYISGWAMYLIAIGFLLALPAGLLAFGVVRWVVRRRA
jgi:ABC-type uncharacterized transport system involved in gliding motility auxiliary subunit